ncbi:MAG: hypothetical protein U0136_16920 [Bdellovibrionota bacterium]
MGYNFSQRISMLKQQTDDALQGRIGLMKAFFRAFLPLAILAFTINSICSDAYDVPGGDADPDLAWESKVNMQFDERVNWLQATPFFLSPGGASMYKGYGKTVVQLFHHKREHKGIVEDLFSLEGVKDFFSQFFTNIFLRGGFVLIAFWPYWIIGFVSGYYAFRGRFRGKRTEDLLGACDRGVTPFYSGIYGPLRSNNSFSATDFTCPNLATPGMVKKEVAVAHPLVQTLNKFGANNSTNTDLVRVILNYADYPSFVEGEQASEEEPEGSEPPDKQAPPVAPFVTNNGMPLEQGAMEGLDACLSAHAMLKEYVALASQRQLSHTHLNSHFEAHLALVKEVAANVPHGAMLLSSLTPHRAWALAQIPSTMIASAYLATEAGKCLVYQRQGAGFVRISRYPHLQARAVIQSIVSWGKEYNGDARLVMRQAIICSRRHGDFGRAFLPDRMPVESRALRDWLEVLYAEPKKREIVAQLVELDAHIEEVSVNWRAVYSRRMRQALDIRNAPEVTPGTDPSVARFWKGVVYKSVVLVPLSEVIAMALRGVDEFRLKRMVELINLSQRYQTSISISARLPGFKRQATEVQNAVQTLAGKAGSKGLLDRWLIVRRMLTRYNWLSTRVGDDAVPDDGVIMGVILANNTETQAPEVHALDALVPIRQRRYDEMFGKSWETVHYIDSPHPSNLRIFIEREKFEECLKQERANLGKNFSGGPRAISA